MTKIIDTHTHLYLPEFKQDIKAVIDRADAENIIRFYLPNIDSEVIDDMLELEKKFPGKCFPMMGLHPCSVKENYKEELQLLEEWLNKRKFVAVGEIGLDYYWDITFREQQIEAFQLQIDWALKYDIPIVIHSRNSLQDCIDIVRQKQNGKLKGIFHCFSGNANEANQIIDLNFLMGMGGVITYKNSGMAEVVAGIDIKHLVLETDAPYLTPVPFRGKRNEPSYLKYVVEKIAMVKNISTEEVASVTTQNAKNLFGS
ncbi:MAG: TatD family hydrolase [Sphingobacteriales bacterium]|nr:TatD family hydrolase [Sphingobacteriales bacterium]MBI3718226.1 TatD family hydrolase [Sphingobacteriales bacterium]